MSATMVRVGAVKVYPTPTGVRVGTTKNKVRPVSDVYALLGKGQARQLRKRLRAAGFAAHAAQPRS